MKTLSGIEMMTVGEIIRELTKYPFDSVMTFQKERDEGTEWSVLESVTQQHMEWFDNGKGVVKFKDNLGNVVFTVTHKDYPLTANPA